MCCPTNKVIKVCTAMHLRMLKYPIRFSTTTVLCTYSAGVRKRRCDETVKRLSATQYRTLRVTFLSKSVLMPYLEYIISRTENKQYLMSLGETTFIEPFSLREYGKRFSSNFLLIKSFVSKKILALQLHTTSTRTSGDLTIL